MKFRIPISKYGEVRSISFQTYMNRLLSALWNKVKKQGQKNGSREEREENSGTGALKLNEVIRKPRAGWKWKKRAGRTIW